MQPRRGHYLGKEATMSKRSTFELTPEMEEFIEEHGYIDLKSNAGFSIYLEVEQNRVSYAVYTEKFGSTINGYFIDRKMVDRMTEKAPKYDNNMIGIELCPSCNRYVSSAFKYCPRCGQALLRDLNSTI